MAGYLGVDPVLVRLFWLVALFSGIGFFAYLVCWLIVPKAPSWPLPSYQVSPSGTEKRDGVGPVASGLLIITLAAVLGLHFDGLGAFVLPAALVGFGIYLLNQRAEHLETVTPAGVREPAGAGTLFEPLAASALPGEAVATERTGIVTPTVLSLFAVAGGFGWALHSAGVIALSVTTACALGLVIVGLGLIASLWVGRARGLVPLGIGLTVVMLTASATETWFDDAPSDTSHGHDEPEMWGGKQAVQPTSLAELDPEYRLGVGELTLDLSGLDLGGTTQYVDLEVGVGKLIVIVPSQASVEVTGEVGIGKARALDAVGDGIGQRVKDSELVPGAGKLIIDFEVGIGEGTVRREF
jgi:hypothetical protein